jgi:sarcosine oxidase subunit alpha
MPMKSLGHVTSSYFSANLGRSIALALVSGGRARVGQGLHVARSGGAIPVKVVGSVFFDPKGARLNA